MKDRLLKLLIIYCKHAWLFTGIVYFIGGLLILYIHKELGFFWGLLAALSIFYYIIRLDKTTK